MSSPLILSLSTVFALIGIVLVAIAFGTNNWQEVHVDRTTILRTLARNSTLRFQLVQVNVTDVYYDRTYGLFRKCFPTQVPNGIGTYLSPLGATCVTRKDYQIPEDRSETDLYSESQKTRMHLQRTCVAFYLVGLAFLFFCLFTGITGCWRRSPGLILTTGILLLFSTLFLAASMAVWHGIDYLEREVIDVAPFYKTWHPLLQENTNMTYGWSYIISWIGIGFILISSILMLAAYRAMKEEEREEYDRKRAPYMMPNYYDKAMMPYAGQQQAAYGYGPYAAYPANAYYGNYATYGNQAPAANGYNGYYLTYGR